MDPQQVDLTKIPDAAPMASSVNLSAIPDAAPESPVMRFIKGAWRPIGGMLDTADRLGKEGADLIHERGLTAIPDAVSGVVKGVVRGMVEPAGAIGAMVAGGHPVDAGISAADQVIPVSDVSSRIKSGDYAGAAGEAASAAAMLFGPHAISEHLGGQAPVETRPEVSPVEATEPAPVAHAVDLSAIPDAAPVPAEVAAPAPEAVPPAPAVDLTKIPDRSLSPGQMQGMDDLDALQQALHGTDDVPTQGNGAPGEAPTPSDAEQKAAIIAQANDEARFTDRTTGDFEEGPGGLTDVLNGKAGRITLPSDVPAPTPTDNSVTLHSEIIPGAAAFAKYDLAPIADGLKAVAEDFKNLVSPQTASGEAQSAADTVREAKAATANSAAVEMLKYKDDVKTFDRQTDGQNLASIATYERTGSFPLMPEGYSQRYRESMSTARALLQEAYGKDSVGYLDNYVRRAFVFDSPADEAKGMASIGRTLSASRAPLRGRVLDMPIDEALNDMRARGINVKLATTNPEALRQWSLVNAHQAANMANALRDLKAQGAVTFVPADGSARVPSGLVALDEKGWRYFDPKEKGIGTYYADPNVARVLNNAVSKGLGGSPTFQGLRAINSSLNELQLGMSAFHATGTAINAGLVDLSTGLRQVTRGLMRGDKASTATGLEAVGRSIVPAASAVRFLNEGRKLINGLKTDNPEAYRTLYEQINPSGARLQMESKYRSQAVDTMQKAWSQGNIWGTAFRMPFAIVETFAKPLMQYAIPRIKLGVLMDRIADVDARMPDAAPADRARAYAAASDQIDNVFGLLVYDNGFWNKTAQDLAQVSTRSVGWTGGSLRWGLGAVADIRGAAVDAVKGGGRPLMTDRVMDALTLPLYVGTIGAAYMYLHTGKGPQSALDYFYPQNGHTDASGAPSRTTLPTYMKDVAGYAQAPVQTLVRKQSPILESAWSFATNRDYWNDMIRNPDDSIAQQAAQVGKELLTNALPISLTQAAKVKREGTNPVEPFFGFTKASRAVTDSPLEAFLGDLAQQHHDPLSPEDAQAAAARRDVRQDVRAGDMAKARQDAADGKLGAKTFLRTGVSAQKNYLVSAFGHLTFEQAVKGYTIATPAQRTLLRPVLARKAGAAVEDATDDTRGDIIKALQAARALPVASGSHP